MLHCEVLPFPITCNGYSVLTSGGRKGSCLAAKCIAVNGKVHVNRWLRKCTI